MSQLDTLSKSALRTCRVCKWLTLAGVVLLFIQLFVDNGLETIAGDYWNMLSPQAQENTKLGPIKKAIVYAIASLNYVSMLLLGLATWRIFHTIEKKGPFTKALSSSIMFLGIATITAACVSIVLPTLMILALTFDNPPGTRELTISFSSGAIALLLIGMVIHILGGILYKATEIAEENRQFV